MSEEIVYDDSVLVDIFRSEVCEHLGAEAWDSLTEGCGVPDIYTEGQSGCKTMREVMKRLDAMADRDVAKRILSHVRHGLKPSQFAKSRERFASYPNLDAFIEAGRADGIAQFQRLRDTGESFFGQAIDDAALAFIVSEPGLVSPVRRGTELHVTAFPANMVAYLQETDVRRKRYHACHCPFARESILREGEEVSSTLCNCSLGHVKVMWEAIVGEELDGDVVSSVLAGDTLCRYVIHLPQTFVEQHETTG